jgi:hypothetical protein
MVYVEDEDISPGGVDGWMDVEVLITNVDTAQA